MNDIKQPSPLPSDVNAGEASPMLSSTRQTKPRSKFGWWIGACLIGGVGCLNTAVCAATTISLLSGFASEQEAVAYMVNAFMLAMVNKEIDQAATLFLDHPQQAEIRASLENMLTGANFAVFDGYQAIELLDSTIGLQSASLPDEPHGLVAAVSGSVIYAGGDVGDFEAGLVKTNSGWKLYTITVTIPPETIEVYLNRQIERRLRFVALTQSN